MHSFETKNRS